MKVIRKGPAWTLKTECSKCHSLLVVEEDDVWLASTTRAPVWGETCWTCPECCIDHPVLVPDYLKDKATAAAKWNVGQE